MIDAKEYNLIYFCKTTGEQFFARRLGDGRMSLLVNGEAVAYSPFILRKKYRASRENIRLYMKPEHVRLRRLSGLHNTKKFKEYLGEEGKEVRENY